MSPYRDWFVRVLKSTNKLQETIDSDLLQQFNQLQNAQAQLHEVMVRNEELEQANIQLKKFNKKHAGGGGGLENYNSRNENGSYDDLDRSYGNDNSFGAAQATNNGNKELI